MNPAYHAHAEFVCAMGTGKYRKRYSIRKLDNLHIHNTWPVAKEGLPFILISGIVTLLFALFTSWYLSAASGLVTLFVIFFFRDPERIAPHALNERGVLTPADGTILEVRHFSDTNSLLGEPAIRVSIFMSIFNVHVNRVPVSGRIEKTVYHPGRFFSANLDKASKENERNVITLKTPKDQRIVFIQIAGLIARRIACWIEKGHSVARGERFGLIRFGSRLEVYLPADSDITIKVRQKVKAGRTVIGFLPQSPN